MKKMLKSRFMRSVACVLIVTTTVLALPVGALAGTRRKTNWGRTQTLGSKQLKAIEAKNAKMQGAQDVRVLSAKDMKNIYGSGLRHRYLCGTMPWQRSFHDVNLSNGNLFKSFTDIQVSPAVGAGLVLQRTYNSNDDTIGPFGRGWTHSYDIKMEEASSLDEDPQYINVADREDFFGGRHQYRRDADGLYTPPVYTHDWLVSDYNAVLADGPQGIAADTQASMDGTIKHFANKGGGQRVCDSIKDRFEKETTLEYLAYPGLAKELLYKVTDPSERELIFTWEPQDPNGDPSSYRITEISGPLQKVTYEYYKSASEEGAGGEAYNLKAVHLDPGGLNRTTTFKYTTFSYTDLSDPSHPVSHEDKGLLASVTDLLGNVVSYTYQTGPVIPSSADTEATAIWVATITEPGGEDDNGNPRPHLYSIWFSNEGVVFDEKVDDYPHATGFEYLNHTCMYIIHDGAGRVTAMHDAGVGGAVQPYTAYFMQYNGSNQVEKSWKCISGQREGGPSQESVNLCTVDNYKYDCNGNVTEHWTDGYNKADGITPAKDTYTYYEYDRYFQKRTATDAAGHTTYYYYGSINDTNKGNRGNLLYVWDARHAPTNFEDPDSPINPDNVNKFKYEYYPNGQKKKETNLKGAATEYFYNDQWGNLTRVVQNSAPQPDRITDMEYDAAGRVKSRIDPNGKESTITYNSVGQPDLAYFPPTANTPAETVDYEYEANGRLDFVTDNRGKTEIEYQTGSDRIESVTDPVMGTITYTYTLHGSVKSKLMPGSRTWTYNYETQYRGFDKTRFPVWPKDDPASIGEALDSIVDDEGRVVYYEQTSSGGVSHVEFNQTFQLDQNNNPIRTSYCVTDYYYEGTLSNDRLPGILGNNQNLFLTKGQIGKIVTKYYWTTEDQPGTWVWHEKLLSQNVYQYDDLGNRKINQVTVLEPGGQQYSTHIERYGYDELNRLKTADYGVGGQYQTYYFDDMGNRTQKTDTLAGTESYSYNNANMLISRNGQSYVNDANGNTLSGGGRLNTWDSQNRLVQCVKNPELPDEITSTFTYGQDGLRRKMVVNDGTTTKTTDYLVDGQSVIGEVTTDGTDTSAAMYLTGPRGPEYRRVDSDGDGDTDQISWYLYDGLGTVLGEVDESGNVTCNNRKDVYGLTRPNSPPDTSTSGHKFVGSLGHSTDDSTDLIYMRARHYDPALGRFISQDPAGDGFNWYVYCRNNPVNLVDYSGKSILPPLTVIEELLFSAIAAWMGYEQVFDGHDSNPLREHLAELATSVAAMVIETRILMKFAELDKRSLISYAQEGLSLAITGFAMCWAMRQGMAIAAILMGDGCEAID